MGIHPQLRNGEELRIVNFLVIFISSWKAGADKMTKKINTLSGLLNPSSRRIVFLETWLFIDGKGHMDHIKNKFKEDH